MKHKFLYGLLALLFVGSLFAFNRENKAETVFHEKTAAGELAAVGTTMYEYTYTKDTITNAANDTLYLPSRLRPVNSDFLISVAVTRTSISGTHNLAVKVEESNYNYTGSTPPTAGWVASLNSAGTAAATAATTATEELLRIPSAWSKSYRVIIDGTGTQSSSYVIRLVMKKKD